MDPKFGSLFFEVDSFFFLEYKIWIQKVIIFGSKFQIPKLSFLDLNLGCKKGHFWIQFLDPRGTCLDPKLEKQQKKRCVFIGNPNGKATSQFFVGGFEGPLWDPKVSSFASKMWVLKWRLSDPKFGPPNHDFWIQMLDPKIDMFGS